jgi:DNA (cytosine-5)-methyltransferase 1
MRKRLHMNLVHHGRAICNAQRPRCSACILVSFCAYGRNRISDLERNMPVVLDLFAGVGGMGSGFRLAGYRIGLAAEKNRNAAQTYRINNPGVPVVEIDVRTLSAAKIRAFVPGIRKIDVVIAGPPCQGYSAAGRREPQDPRNRLYYHVGRLAQELKATLVVFENVPGLLSVNGTGFLRPILSSLRARGYSARPHLLRACDFGIPQTRRRLFILARKRSVGGAPSPPPPTHRPPGERKYPDLPMTPTVLQALKGLPRLGPGVYAEWRPRADGSALLNASTMDHSSQVIEKISRISPGCGPISYRRLEPSLARTLIAGHRALPVHPRLDRTISVREAARLQGFSDTYVFCGPRAEQPLQVADAVPPPLGQIMAAHLRNFLRRCEQPRGSF